ncbi:MAG: hypothetical protein ONB06_08005 [candidate division KSB1 bacterium]|nr:hypothetical protein [candidate division KSB1 bacterium]
MQQRKGKKVARVAPARRLAEIVYHVWRDNTDYFEVLRRSGVRG